MDNEQSLEFQAGVGGGAYVDKFKELRVDNGDDTRGTNATGEFVNKTGKKGNFTREQFGKNIEAVVLLQRSKIKKTKIVNGAVLSEWWSDEFNSLNTAELIKIRKPDTKGFFEMTYKQIQERFPKVQGVSQMKNPFTYTMILYIKEIKTGEIFKLHLTGKNMKNWIDFRGEMSGHLWDNTIMMNIVESEDKKNFNINFTIGVTADYKRVKLDVGDLISQLPINKSIALEPVKEAAQIEQPTPKEEEIPVINVDDDMEEANMAAQDAASEKDSEGDMPPF